jgi:hypothetical protein
VGEVVEPSLRKSAIPLVVTGHELSDRALPHTQVLIDISQLPPMGARESKPQQVTDYYELLQIDENATLEEIKVSP